MAAPIVGAWIEIMLKRQDHVWWFAAPIVGAWIEIYTNTDPLWTVAPLLSWERGLKL